MYKCTNSSILIKDYKNFYNDVGNLENELKSKQMSFFKAIYKYTRHYCIIFYINKNMNLPTNKYSKIIQFIDMTNKCPRLIHSDGNRGL